MEGSVTQRMLTRLRKSIACALGALTFVPAPSPAQEPALEFAVKATYLYKFAPFITWPPEAAQKSTFELCLSGNDEVVKVVPEAAAGQEINGRPIVIRRLAENDSTDSCQILYVANGVFSAALLDAVRRKAILTVTDSATPDHGIIGFTMIDHHVRFNIDAGLAAEAGLTVSSKLLSLASAVTSAQGAAR